ncbi:MAG: hypothetical protein V4562_12040 [Pseudomonadota bacterium]
MGPIDSLIHLLNFVAPAVFVAGCLLLAARFLGRPQRAKPVWWLHWGLNAAAGSGALLAGLLLFGRDGKMASYALLVAACAVGQWVLAGDWKR